MSKRIDFEPKYITFDCYGTLIDFAMSCMARDIYSAHLGESADLDRFVALFAAYRLDETLGAYKPYRDVIASSLRRACARFDGVAFDDSAAARLYAAIPSWGAHADVPAGLARLATKYRLVILSNAADDQIGRNVAKLGAPFYRVFTAEQARAYKPRMQAFEYMFAQLGCGPEDVLHVSSSLRYDLMTAASMGVAHKVLVRRGHEPEAPGYGYYEVDGIGELADMLGV